jgi:hypothetical protein
MLKELEGRIGTKAEKNWEIINKILDQVFNIYVLLTPRIEKGKFNIFLIPENN